MAISFTATKNSCTLKLNNGTQSGVVKTVNVSLGRLSPQTGDVVTDSTAQTKAFNIAGLLGNCLEKEIYSIEAGRIGRLTNE